ncbi:MAG: hypothetical protein O3C67_11040, partial [Cyanobacteria bacterium]|nr:hypothetical protein [Cyanobacteriota bacterium]
IHFRMQSDPPQGETATVFLVLRYSDPRDRVGNGSAAAGVETFALVETTDPQPEDVELCRLVMTAGQPDLSGPHDVLAPGPNQPDLRHRPLAQLRPQGQVQMVAIGDDPPGEIAALGAAVPALYGPLAPLPPLPLSPAAVATADPTPWDWVSLSAPVARGLDSGALATLRTHLGQGGGVLVAMDVAQTGLAALYPLVMELQQAIAAARREDAPADLQASLQQELAAVRGNIAGQVATLLQALQGFAMAVGCPLQGSGDIPADHPLRRHPFSFSRWPDLGDQPLQVRAWGGLVVVLGALPAAWGADPALDLPREQVRNAQELGVNLLHYGWYRRHLHRLQGTPAEKSSKGSDSLRDRLSEGGL